MDTLVLNADGNPMSILPLSTISWREGLKTVLRDKAIPISNYDKWKIRTVREEFKVPSIIMAKDFSKWERFVNFCPYNIFMRDMMTCQLQITKECKNKNGKHYYNDLTLDHVKAKKYGGLTNWENIVTACKHCNSKKGDKKDIKPLIIPYKPNYYKLIANRKLLPLVIKDLNWLNHLDWDYDLVYLQKQKGEPVKLTEYLNEPYSVIEENIKHKDIICQKNK